MSTKLMMHVYKYVMMKSITLYNNLKSKSATDMILVAQWWGGHVSLAKQWRGIWG